MKLILKSYGSPYYGQNPREPVNGSLTEIVEINTIQEGQNLASDYITRNNLRLKNWKGGLIFSNNLKTYHGVLSFNGQYFPAESDYGVSTLQQYKQFEKANNIEQSGNVDQKATIRNMVAVNLRNHIQKSGFSLQDLSAGTGISKNKISGYINGAMMITYDDLEKLAHFLKTEIVNLDPTFGVPKSITKELFLMAINELFESGETISVDDERLKSIWN